MPVSGEFHVGDPWVFRFTIKDEEGNLAKPSTVTAVVMSPAGKEANVSMTEVSLGLYKGTYPELTEAGPWTVSAKCEGGLKGSEPQTIQVKGVFG